MPKHTVALGCISEALSGPVGWGIGYGLISLVGARDIHVPKEHIVGLTPQQKRMFEKEYREDVKKKRMWLFHLSAAIGTSVFAFMVIVCTREIGAGLSVQPKFS